MPNLNVFLELPFVYTYTNPSAHNSGQNKTDFLKR